MARVKSGKARLKRRKNILKDTKGYRWGRKSKLKLAKEAILHASRNAYRDRRNKKRDFRGLWQIKIGASAKELGVSYSQLIHNLKEKNITLDRKVLADLAENYPEIFKEIVENSK
ncbi:50S ribosomal protein L20 [Candidatus Parcubacteria bacterium]|nr:50S ribosomal protein L20 [Patescibacteria group bacterium]MBU4466691.1 50S ribosomal protein L20 [Patescibacteria group bacterium]MCG2688137.1 50S ribosomal protein L20 [Candidatus Parcubacteria bacterium]